MILHMANPSPLSPETLEALRVEGRRLAVALAQAPNAALLRIRRRIVDHLLSRYGDGRFLPTDRSVATDPAAARASSVPPTQRVDDLVPPITRPVAPIARPFDMSSKLARLKQISHANEERYAPLNADAEANARVQAMIADLRSKLTYSAEHVDGAAAFVDDEWVTNFLRSDPMVSEEEILDILMERHAMPQRWTLSEGSVPSRRS